MEEGDGEEDDGKGLESLRGALDELGTLGDLEFEMGRRGSRESREGKR